MPWTGRATWPLIPRFHSSAQQLVPSLRRNHFPNETVRHRLTVGGRRWRLKRKPISRELEEPLRVRPDLARIHHAVLMVHDKLASLVDRESAKVRGVAL